MRPSFGMGLPPFLQGFIQQPEESRSNTEIPVPPRVIKAMEFLQALNNKAATQAVANGLNIEQIPGQKLSEEEETTKITACNLINQYFAGQLQPDTWEKLYIEDVKDRRQEKRQEKTEVQAAAALCPACPDLNSPNMNCPLCRGRGIVGISSYAEK